MHTETHTRVRMSVYVVLAWSQRSWMDDGYALCAFWCLYAGAPTAGNSKCQYKVEVKTGDVRGAGTDGNVTICVYGDKVGLATYIHTRTHTSYQRTVGSDTQYTPVYLWAPHCFCRVPISTVVCLRT